MIRPASRLFLASLSGCQARIPSASPDSIRASTRLKIGRPGVFADCSSLNSSTIVIPSRVANSRSSFTWASIERTCFSSSLEDLRAYSKSLMVNSFYTSMLARASISLWISQLLFHLARAASFAILERSRFESFAARALPPFAAPSLERATAAGFLGFDL